MCRRGRVPAACGNKILSIFAPYTFSHGQGHDSPVAERQILEEDQTKWLTVKGIQCHKQMLALS
jgi:hypothetical protein